MDWCSYCQTSVTQNTSDSKLISQSSYKHCVSHSQCQIGERHQGLAHQTPLLAKGLDAHCRLPSALSIHSHLGTAVEILLDAIQYNIFFLFTGVRTLQYTFLYLKIFFSDLPYVQIRIAHMVFQSR